MVRPRHAAHSCARRADRSNVAGAGVPCVRRAIARPRRCHRRSTARSAGAASVNCSCILDAPSTKLYLRPASKSRVSLSDSKEDMMNRVFQFCTSVFLFVAVFGFSSNADATITGLCVGCTSNSQFEAAAWQTFGQAYTQGINLLIINPGTGLSK